MQGDAVQFVQQVGVGQQAGVRYVDAHFLPRFVLADVVARRLLDVQFEADEQP